MTYKNFQDQFWTPFTSHFVDSTRIGRCFRSFITYPIVLSFVFLDIPMYSHILRTDIQYLHILAMTWCFFAVTSTPSTLFLKRKRYLLSTRKDWFIFQHHIWCYFNTESDLISVFGLISNHTHIYRSAHIFQFFALFIFWTASCSQDMREPMVRYWQGDLWHRYYSSLSDLKNIENLFNSIVILRNITTT